MVGDRPELASDELVWIGKMKKMMEEPAEEEEILQTKVISTREVAQHWNQWLAAIDEEVQSLLEEKQAMKKNVELQKKASSEGRGAEIIPSKLVFTVKARPNGGRKKTRWVICGNYEAKKESEQNFSSGADSAAFRMAVLGSCPPPMAGSGFGYQNCFPECRNGTRRKRRHLGRATACAVH